MSSPPAEAVAAVTTATASINDTTTHTEESPAGGMEPLDPHDELEVDDDDSALGAHEIDSTASITDSIRNYRKFKGRSYHASRQHDDTYFVPLDETVLDNYDLMHHFLTLLLEDKLVLAPIPEKLKNVLDIGTGTGLWAIDFADEHPEASVTGTDISPVQPMWVPPNLRFEIEDCSTQWTRDDDSFDFVHIRYLFGAIRDWTALFREAYRVLKPGSYLESCESEPALYSDDGTVTTDGKTTIGGLWGHFFAEGGKATGCSMTVLADDLQVIAMREAGFVDIQQVTYKVPMGGWAKDSRLSHIGRCIKMSLESDLDGYTQMLWHHILKWPEKEHQVFLMQVRKDLKNPYLHPYTKVRYVWGRKPS